MKKFLRFLPPSLVVTLVFFLFKDFFFLNKLPLPGDTLIGAYFPWLDYKWGFPVGVPVKNPPTSDAFSQFFVWKKVLVDTVLNGQIPLWNPTSLMGTPLLATFHSSVLNPGNLLLFFPKIGWGLYIFTSVLLSGLSMFLYLSLWTKSNRSKSIATVIYILSGPMTTWTEFGTAVYAAAFLPLVFYFLHTFTLKPQKKTALLLSLSVCLLSFSGHVQILTYAIFIIPFYLLYLKKGFKAVPFVLFGLMLASVQFLPTLSFYQRSIRSEEHYSWTFNYGLSPLNQSIRMWAADFYGHPTTRNHFSDVSYHEYSSFLGFLTLPLIFSLWFDRKLLRKTIFPSLIFIATLLFAFDNPFSRYVFSLSIPLLTYSSASRIFFILNFAATILLAIRLEDILNSKFIKSPIVFVLLFIAITFSASYLVPQESKAISQRNIIPYLAVGTTFILASVFLYKRPLLLYLAIFFLYSLDLGRYFLKYNTFFPTNLTFPSTPVLDFLTKQPPPFRLARQNTNLLTPSSWSYYGLESIEGYDPLYSSDYSHFFNLLSGNPYDNDVSRYAILNSYDRRFLDALNVKYYLTINPKEKIGWKKVFSDKSVSVLENQNVLPRAYFAQKILVANDKSDLIRQISSSHFDPRMHAVITTKPAQVLGYDPKSSISITKYTSQELALSVKTSLPSFVIVSNSYDPGWRASINGQNSKVFKTNASMIGVEVGAGESSIRLYYLPREFIIGGLISLLSVLIIFIGLKFV